LLEQQIKLLENQTKLNEKLTYKSLKKTIQGSTIR